MSKLVSASQAAKNAVAAFLQNAINNPPAWMGKPVASVIVEPRWPDPKKLPERAITIIDAGPYSYGADPVLGWWHEAELVDPQPPGLPTGMQMWRWVVGWYEQPVQLDIWSWSDIDRDDLITRLEYAIRTGPGDTTSLVGDPISDYIILPMLQVDDQLGLWCSADFSEDGPTRVDTSMSASRTMYRATWKGSIGFTMTVKAVSFPIAKVIFQLKMREDTVPTAGDPIDLQVLYPGSGHAISRPNFNLTGTLGTRQSQPGLIELGKP